MEAQPCPQGYSVKPVITAAGGAAFWSTVLLRSSGMCRGALVTVEPLEPYEKVTPPPVAACGTARDIGVCVCVNCRGGCPDWKWTEITLCQKQHVVVANAATLASLIQASTSTLMHPRGPSICLRQIIITPPPPTPLGPLIHRTPAVYPAGGRGPQEVPLPLPVPPLSALTCTA